MAGVRIRIQVADQVVRQAIAGLAQAGEDLTPAHDEIGLAMVASTLHRFETETDPAGNPWVPSLRAQTQGGQTLTEKGQLRQSITHEADGRSVAWGTNVIYGAIHQLGGTIRAKGGGTLHFQLANGQFVMVDAVTMPQRAFLGVNRDDRAEIRAIYADHFDRASGGNLQEGAP